MHIVTKSVERLPEHPLLDGLDAAQQERMRLCAERYRLEPGELLFRAGDAAKRFFVLESGQVKLHRISASGHEKIIELMTGPAVFAEAVMFMQPQRYPVNCEALVTSLVVGLSMEEFMAIVGESQATVFRLLKTLSVKLRARVEDIEALSSQNAVLRVVIYILSLTPDPSATSTVVELPFSKKSVAARLSLQPETLSRTFARLRTAGLIKVDGNTIEIPALDDLRELALTGQTDNLAI
jgi:CRP-like cAMP-binding protein